MNIDWGSLALVAVTTVVAAIAIVGIFASASPRLTSRHHGRGRRAQLGRRAAARLPGMPASGCPACSCCTGCT